jgi:hypothetical protein
MAENENRALRVVDTGNDLPRNDTSSAALILSGDGLERAMRFAEFMASGKSTIPVHLRGSKGDCLAITMQAMRWGMDPFAVAQKTHLSQSGSIGYEGQLVNAVIIANAPINGRPEHEYIGDWNKVLGKVEERKSDKPGGGKYYVATYTKKDEDGLGIRVWATFIGEDKPRETVVMMSQAYPRFSTQWATDPKQQILYLAGRKWARAHAPDVILGVYTPEELEAAPPSRDMGRADVVQQASPVPSDELLKQAKSAASKGVAAYQKFWSETGKDNRSLLQNEHEGLKDTAVAADRNRTVENETQGAAEPAGAAPLVTFATVDSSLRNATERKDSDALYAAADMIRTIADDDQRQQLTAIFHECQASLEGGAQ